MYEVRRYVNASGKDVIGEWMEKLKDSRAKAKINVRIARLRLGNFGDAKHLRGGVWEMRVDYGPGYRVYFARLGQQIVLLLCGGDKSTQSKDISRAVKLLRDFKERSQ